MPNESLHVKCRFFLVFRQITFIALLFISFTVWKVSLKELLEQKLLTGANNLLLQFKVKEFLLTRHFFIDTFYFLIIKYQPAKPDIIVQTDAYIPSEYEYIWNGIVPLGKKRMVILTIWYPFENLRNRNNQYPVPFYPSRDT